MGWEESTVIMETVDKARKMGGLKYKEAIGGTEYPVNLKAKGSGVESKNCSATVTSLAKRYHLFSSPSSDPSTSSWLARTTILARVEATEEQPKEQAQSAQRP